MAHEKAARKETEGPVPEGLPDGGKEKEKGKERGVLRPPHSFARKNGSGKERGPGPLFRHSSGACPPSPYFGVFAWTARDAMEIFGESRTLRRPEFRMLMSRTGRLPDRGGQ